MGIFGSRLKHRSSYKKSILVAALLILLLLAGWLVWSKYLLPRWIGVVPEESVSQEAPQFETSVIIEGLDHPWDLAFVDGDTFFVNERPGRISVVDSGQRRIIATPEDVYVRGEGGLLGLAIDPNFDSNRYIYTCFNSKTADHYDVRVVRWRVDENTASLTERTDIVTGLPANVSGRHSGCRPRFGPDGYLWIGTGDAASGANPQDPKSLGGKILRVDRDGKPAPGNLGEPFDPRIYSYGHRNVQALAFNPPSSSIIGYNTEHGPDRDDEINELTSGNFGWDPVPGYNEDVPMTDLAKFPGAIQAVWSSGRPTTAVSGAAIISGKQWQGWDGALAAANLKGRHLRILSFSDTGEVTKEEIVLNDLGRLRGVSQSPDGDLYVTTDNGDSQDVIVRISPR